MKEESIVDLFARRAQEPARLSITDIDFRENFFQNPHVRYGFEVINDNGILKIKGGSRDEVFPVGLDMEKHFDQVRLLPDGRKRKWFTKANENKKIYQDLVKKDGPFESQWKQYFVDMDTAEYINGLVWGPYHPVEVLLTRLRSEVPSIEIDEYGK